MAMFRSIPSIIEANQYTEKSEPCPGVCFCVLGNVNAAHVHTAQGQIVFVSPGEWIVKEPIGDGYYPVSDAVFPKRWKELKGEQWFPGKIVPGVCGANKNKLCGCVVWNDYAAKPHVHPTMFSAVLIEPGDFIIPIGNDLYEKENT